ncbi:hypothetical protein XELAEV_18014371mg [Xenopus laevis]|uniref:Uncharacterized protein n=1 Tax=Xenopus laevis TaxID=8355 RepID=A0A974DHS8_XENLA|nr:hypothetical protein XELAEV_18014371mg [Xenopus laevis]
MGTMPHRFLCIPLLFVILGLAQGQLSGLQPDNSLSENGNRVIRKSSYLPMSPTINMKEKIKGKIPPLGGVHVKPEKMPWHSSTHKRGMGQNMDLGVYWHRFPFDRKYNYKYLIKEK